MKSIFFLRVLKLLLHSRQPVVIRGPRRRNGIRFIAVQVLPQLESGERCHSLVCEHSLGGDLEREGEKGGRRHAGRWGGEGREGRGKEEKGGGGRFWGRPRPAYQITQY